MAYATVFLASSFFCYLVASLLMLAGIFLPLGTKHVDAIFNMTGSKNHSVQGNSSSSVSNNTAVIIPLEEVYQIGSISICRDNDCETMEMGSEELQQCSTSAFYLQRAVSVLVYVVSACALAGLMFVYGAIFVVSKVVFFIGSAILFFSVVVSIVIFSLVPTISGADICEDVLLRQYRFNGTNPQHLEHAEISGGLSFLACLGASISYGACCFFAGLGAHRRIERKKIEKEKETLREIEEMRKIERAEREMDERHPDPPGGYSHEAGGGFAVVFPTVGRSAPRLAHRYAAPRTLANSIFYTLYTDADVAPQQLHHLMAAVHELIREYADSHFIPRGEADIFFEKLQRNAYQTGGVAEVLNPAQLMHIALRLWTSAETLRGREFCGILNEALRNDERPAIEYAATIARAVNAFCVKRRGQSIWQRWPRDNKLYRGGAMPREHQRFFRPGKKYRAPMYVATSKSLATARSFLDRVPPHQETVLWVFCFDESLPLEKRCVHVNYVNRTDGTVGEEDEMLFPPYSTFTVREVRWQHTPKVIAVGVAADNKNERNDLPLAPWC